jgi:hypothetical protein
MEYSVKVSIDEHGVGHSQQTSSFAPAASLTRAQLRNFCYAKDQASLSRDGLLME